MYKVRSLLGLPVLETENGTQIGEVQEVILNFEQAAIVGVIVASSNWFAGEQGIIFQDLLSIGRDALMVRNSSVVQKSEEFVNTAMNKLLDLVDKQIYTETGLQLGILVDFIFDHLTGEIKAYQVSDGLVTDILNGRMLLPVPQAQTIGQDKVIVPENMANLLHTESNLE